MSKTEARVPQPGTPCPRGCATGPRREVPELLVMNEDREVSCHECWDCFGILPEGDTALLSNRQED